LSAMCEHEVDLLRQKTAGGERVFRRMMAAMEKATRQLRLDGPHDFEILPNDRWETYQRPYLAKTPFRTVVGFACCPCSNPEREACYELEGFLRFLIFECKSWRPATNTSLIITLLPKHGFSSSLLGQWHLLGMRDNSGMLREMNLMVERYPRFPTLRSLEEYCWSRMPYEMRVKKRFMCWRRISRKGLVLLGRRMFESLPYDGKSRSIKELATNSWYCSFDGTWKERETGDAAFGKHIGGRFE